MWEGNIFSINKLTELGLIYFDNKSGNNNLPDFVMILECSVIDYNVLLKILRLKSEWIQKLDEEKLTNNSSVWNFLKEFL